MIDFIWDRISEISTWSGISLVILGVLILIGNSAVPILAYIAILWGIYSMWYHEA